MERVFVGLIRFMDPDPGRFFSLFESYILDEGIIRKSYFDLLTRSITCVEEIMTCSKALFMEAMESCAALPGAVSALMPDVTIEVDDGVVDLGETDEGETRLRTV